MKGPSYISLVMKHHRGFAVFSGIVAASLQFLVIKAITSIDADTVSSLILSQLPERFRMMINETLISRMTVEGAAAFGFNHPIVMVLVAINAVAVPAKHISGEIESGTMELLLSHPVRRVKLFFSMWSAAAAINLFVVVGALLGSLTAVTAAGVLSRSLAGRLVGIALILWLLSLVVTALAALASAWATRGARPVLWVAVVVLTLYVIHFLTPLWGFLEIMIPFNIFTYYQPQKLMFGEASFGRDALVLAGVTLVLLAAAAHRFQTRDIPG
jgi:ABC-2 type transport system permease protein